MKQVNISIIIPFYNGQKYVQECMESILSQRDEGMEIILVDDGSENSVVEVCDAYAQQYENITLMHQPHRGVSAARNAGMKIARGEYITFVDCDDVLAENWWSTLQVELQKKCDLLIYNYFCKCEEEALKGYEIDLPEMTGDLSDSCMRSQFVWDFIHFKYAFNVWNKVYKLSIIREHQITFTDSVGMGEDIGFNLAYLCYCNQFSVRNERLYGYRIHRESVMKYGHIWTPHLDEFILFIKDVEKHILDSKDKSLKKALPVFFHELMMNQYANASRQELYGYIYRMKCRKLYQRYVRSVLLHGNQFLAYFGKKGTLRVLSYNVKLLLFGVHMYRENIG